MRVRPIAAVLLLVFGPWPAVGAQSPDVDLDDVLDRAVRYVTGYEAELGMIIGEEEYVQDAAWFDSSRRPRTVTDRERRRLRSDFLLLPLDLRWYGVRSVRIVDGNPVDTPNEVPTSIEEIVTNRADTQYNIGDFARTFNVPTFPLTFLRPDSVHRFEFDRDGEDRIEGVGTWKIRYQETARPTLVRGAGGEDRFAHGYLWVEPTTGRILRTEVAFEVEGSDAGRGTYAASQRVSYRENAVLALLVPASMDERYSSDFHTVDARADYSDFQRFSVRIDLDPTSAVD